MGFEEIRPKFLFDADGNKVAVQLTVEEYERLIEKMEMDEDVAVYDERKANLGELSSLEEYERRRFGKE